MRVRTAEELGLTIRDRRAELGLSQAELASRIGATRYWVIAVEKGKPRAEVGLLLAALDALDLDVLVEPRRAPADEADLDALIERHRG